MESFSQKYRYKPARTVIQIKSMDIELRNGLWNALDIYYLTREGSGWLRDHRELLALFIRLCLDYFKRPLDTMPDKLMEAKKELRKYFFNCAFFEVYDIIQFIVNNYDIQNTNDVFMNYCNTILKRELSGYRFIGDVIAPITSEQEIAEIEEALTSKDSLQPITIHLQSALNLLSDRKSPDYRNSIKESISAIETICKLITKNKKASLSQAIKAITDKIELHSDLQEAFYKLYGYTSDAEGIRHSLMDKPDLDFEDAKFMLVTCSAFVNYLKIKAVKVGVELATK